MSENKSNELTQQDMDKIVAALAKGATVGDVAGMSESTLEGLYALAFNLYSSGNFEDAQKVFQALCVYDHHQYRFWMGLAGCRQALGNLPGAVDAYEFAGIATQLKNPEPFLFAAKCFVKMGKKAEAIDTLKALAVMGEGEAAYEKIHSSAAALLGLLEKKE